MEWSTAIVTGQLRSYEEIAAKLKQTGMTSCSYHCPDLQALAQLFRKARVDLIFAYLTSASDLPGQWVAELLSLADDRNCAVCFISSTAARDLVEAGRIPAGSACLDLSADPHWFRSKLMEIMAARETGSMPVSPLLGGQPLQQSGQLCDRFTFGKLLSKESSRSRLTGRPFAMLLVKPSRSDGSAAGPGGHHEPSWREVARSIRQEIRGSDLMCHLQGTGFVLLLPETSAAMTEHLSERIRSRITGLAGCSGIKVEINTATEALVRQFIETSEYSQGTPPPGR